jgi:hypothetical protein
MSGLQLWAQLELQRQGCGIFPLPWFLLMDWLVSTRTKRWGKEKPKFKDKSTKKQGNEKLKFKGWIIIRVKLRLLASN